MREDKRALFPLPPTNEPTSYKCIQLLVPNEPREFRAAFLGAILGLTKWFAWDRDEQKRGVVVAQAFKPVFDQAFEQLMESGTECDNVEFRQSGCNLEFKVGGIWTVIYTLNANCVAEKLDEAYGGGSWSPPTGRGAGDSRIIDNATEQATSQNDLNRVWGGCLELVESVFDLCRILCDMIEAVGDAAGFVSNMLASPVSQTTEWVADNTTGTTRNWSTNGQSKWDSSSGTQTYERTITDPIRAISPSRLLGIAEDAIDIGVSILRNSFNEDFQEAVAGILFNILTCLPDGNRKTSGIVLTTAILSQFADDLIADSDLIKKFTGVAIKADEIVDSVGFLSLLNLPDLFKQYRIGTTQPSSSWEILVDPCEDPNPEWTVTLNFRTSQHGFGIVDGWGNWVSGAGFAGITKLGTTGSPVNAIIRYWNATPFEIVSMRAFVVKSAGRVYNYADMQATNSAGTGFANVRSVNNFTNGWMPLRTVEQVWNGVRFQSSGTASGGTTTIIQEVEITGRGFNPFA